MKEGHVAQTTLAQHPLFLCCIGAWQEVRLQEAGDLGSAFKSTGCCEDKANLANAVSRPPSASALDGFSSASSKSAPWESRMSTDGHHTDATAAINGVFPK